MTQSLELLRSRKRVTLNQLKYAVLPYCTSIIEYKDSLFNCVTRVVFHVNCSPPKKVLLSFNMDESRWHWDVVTLVGYVWVDRDYIYRDRLYTLLQYFVENIDRQNFVHL